LAPVSESLVTFENQFVDFRSGDTLKMLGENTSLYVVGCIYYEGLDKKQYYSDICSIWSEGTFQSCSDWDRNFVRERPETANKN
jgi:hypothetical protein